MQIQVHHYLHSAPVCKINIGIGLYTHKKGAKGSQMTLHFLCVQLKLITTPLGKSHIRLLKKNATEYTAKAYTAVFKCCLKV